MFLVSIAHLYTFSYRPFTEEGRREKLLLRVTSTDHSLTGPLLSSPTDQCGGDPEDPGARLPEKKKILQEKETASNRGSSSIVSANENGHGHGQRIKCTQSGGHQVDVNTETARGSFDIKGRFVNSVLIPRKGGFRPPISGQTSTPTSVKNNGMIAAGTSNRTLKNLDEQTCNQSNSVFSMLDRNFASSAAVRDFNESMPVIVLPSNFTPEKGRVALSRPSDRVSD